MNQCAHCGRCGIPYTYNDILFDGLHANRGERVCPQCLDVIVSIEGANILVCTRSNTQYVVNTARDRDKCFIGSCELDIADGRDLDREVRRAERNSRRASTTRKTLDVGTPKFDISKMTQEQQADLLSRLLALG